MSKTITPHSGTQVGKLTIWVRAFGMENGSRVQQGYYFSQNSLASLYDGSLSLQRQIHLQGGRGSTETILPVLYKIAKKSWQEWS